MIAILMSTYNGEEYLREQVDSLLGQTEKDWQLFVRDDGSRDGTVGILREYASAYPAKVHLLEERKENLGAGVSFMYLLEAVEADYYMFCDQDDVWMSDKVERTLSKMRSLEAGSGADCPVGVFTDLTVVDSNLEVLYPSLWKADGRHPEYVRDFYRQWTNRHATYGCTQMLNRAAKSAVLPYRQFPGVMGAHDNWAAYILIHDGVYDYLDEPTILYRQHSRNVAGANMGKGEKEEVRYVLRSPSSLIAKLRKDYRRSRLMPFRVSYTRILWMRIVQSLKSIIKS